MADIKISELEPTTDLEGLYTIGTDKNNLSKKVALQFLKDAADYANTQGDYAAGQANNISQNIGMSKYGLFSEANNYGAFSVVRYNDKLWRFTQYHSAGAWLGTDVEQISVLDELAITDLGNILSLDVSKLMTLLEKELYYRYTGVIEISVDGEIYYGTMLHLSKDSEGNLVVRFICENTLYVAVNLGATAWQISKVSDLAEWENKLAQLSEELQALKARVAALEGSGSEPEDPSEPDIPVETRYTINASADNGAVAASVNGVSVDLPYKALKNEVVKLEVLADSGYQFVEWSDGITENPREIEVVTDATYSAVCESSAKTYTLRATADNGSVVAKVNGSAVALPYTAPVNTEVELDVQPIEGYEFTEWSNASNDNPRIVRMTTDKRMNASCELAGNIPADYRILRGIYSNSNNSYFDTGVALDSHSKWDLYFGRTTLNTGNPTVLFGIRRASGVADTMANAFYHSSNSSWSQIAWVYGGTDDGLIAASGFGNKFYGNKHKLSQRGNYLYEWGRQIAHIEKEFENTDGVTAFFGNLAKAKGTTYNANVTSQAIFYRFVLYDDNNVVVKDLRPVQRIEDGKYGVYDIVSDSFIPCVGTWNEWTEESASLRVVGMANHTPSISSETTQTASYYMGYFVTTQDKQQDFIVHGGEITTDGTTRTFPARQCLKCSEFNTAWHGNTAWFGADKWDASDFFPLLYVSTDKANQLLCVYRIKGADPDALEGVELVQKIYTPRETPWYFNNYYGMAGANTFVHAGYTQNSYSSADNDNTIMARVFRLPDPTIGDVTLNESDALATVNLGFQSTLGDGYWTGKYLGITFSHPANNVGKYVIWEISNDAIEIDPSYIIEGFHTSSSDAFLTNNELEGFKYNPFDDVFSLCFEPFSSGRTNLVYYRPYSEYTETKQW